MDVRPTACLACNTHKVKCTKEKPVCSRCNKRRVRCVYPDRVVRKRNINDLDHHRTIPRSGTSNDTTTVGEALASSTDFESTRSLPRPTMFNELAVLSAYDVAKIDPDENLCHILIDVYFSKYLASSLHVDRHEFTEQLKADKLPRYVLYSVFALASRFFCAVPYPSINRSNELLSFPEVPARGRAWAEIASSLVLSHADEPTTFTVFACENLGLYWYGAGELGRLAVHKAISNAACRVLRDRDQVVPTNNVSQSCPPLTTQVLWGCWIKTCMLEHSYLSTIEDLHHTFGYGLEHHSQHTFSYLYDDDVFTLPQSYPSAGDWMNWDSANLRSSAVPCMKLCTAWRDVKALVRCTGSILSESHVAQLFDLDAAIAHIYNGIPMELKGEDALKASASEPLRRNSFWLQSIHYLCLAYLHGSAVPQISGICAVSPGPAILARTSTRTILKDTARFLLLARTYCRSKADFSAMPPLCYWSFFIAGFICGTLVETSIQSCKEHAEHDFQFCSLMLKQLTAFWASASYLYTFLYECFPHIRSASVQGSISEFTRSPVLKSYALYADIVEALTTKVKLERTLPLQFEDIFDLPSRMSAFSMPHTLGAGSSTIPQSTSTNHEAQEDFWTNDEQQSSVLPQGSHHNTGLRHTAREFEHISPALDDLMSTTGSEWRDNLLSEDVLAELGAAASPDFTRVYTLGPSHSLGP